MTDNGQQTTGRPVLGGGTNDKKVQHNTLDRYMGVGTKSGKNGDESKTNDKNDKKTVGTLQNHLQEMNEHWESVIKGPAAKIVQIKQEKIESNNQSGDNQFDVLSDNDDDEEDKNQNSKTANEDEITTPGEDIFQPGDEDVAQYQRIATDTLMEMNLEDVDKMKPAEVSEHVFLVKRC